jgi:hypothetical protein
LCYRDVVSLCVFVRRFNQGRMSGVCDIIYRGLGFAGVGNLSSVHSHHRSRAIQIYPVRRLRTTVGSLIPYCARLGEFFPIIHFSNGGDRFLRISEVTGGFDHDLDVGIRHLSSQRVR